MSENSEVGQQHTDSKAELLAREKSRQNYSLVSVMSRKGGVGKTTVAFQLAELLRARGHHVVLLDLDVAGTPANLAAGSYNLSYGTSDSTEKINIVQSPRGVLDLVERFQVYLEGGHPGTFKWRPKRGLLSNGQEGTEGNGGDAPQAGDDEANPNGRDVDEEQGRPPADAASEHQRSESWHLDSDRVNLISSYLPREYGASTGPGYGPDLLFDELHSKWFIDMLKEMVVTCHRFSWTRNWANE